MVTAPENSVVSGQNPERSSFLSSFDGLFLGRFITQDLSFFIRTMEAVGELILEVSSNFLNILQRYVLLFLQKGNVLPVLVNRGA